MAIIRLKKKSLKTTKLKKHQIIDILNLKEQKWKFGIKSQKIYFKNNTKPQDLHNLFFFGNKLIGYTALKRRTYFNNNRKREYLLFDTLILSKNYRNLKISKTMMSFNNKIIRKNKKSSFLICDKKLRSFYEKFSWTKIKTHLFEIKDLKTKKEFMTFNSKFLFKTPKYKLIIYINK